MFDQVRQNQICASYVRGNIDRETAYGLLIENGQPALISAALLKAHDAIRNKVSEMVSDYDIF